MLCRHFAGPPRSRVIQGPCSSVLLHAASSRHPLNNLVRGQCQETLVATPGCSSVEHPGARHSSVLEDCRASWALKTARAALMAPRQTEICNCPGQQRHLGQAVCAPATPGHSSSLGITPFHIKYGLVLAHPRFLQPGQTPLVSGGGCH